jgi:hypothetical protein
MIALCDESIQQSNNETAVSQDKEDSLEEEKPSVEPLYVEDLIDTPEAEAEWDAQKEKCSFCRHFMLSPCRQEFKKWAKCVDIAKAKDIDFVYACQHYTRALMTCTESNSEYFAATRPDEGDDVQQESEEEQGHEGIQEGQSNDKEKESSDDSRTSSENKNTQVDDKSS